LFQANTGAGLNRDKAKTAGSCAASPHVSPYAQKGRKTAAPKEKEPPVNEKELRHLKAEFLAKKKKFYSMKIDLYKRQVRISK
jgi:hypothetical protein